MINYRASLAILLLVPLALAEDNADAVNERIPVNKAEMETHWQVNCASARNDLLAAAARPADDERCGIAAGLQWEIKLCAFIYQPPGGSSRPGCPDYGGVSKRLEHNGTWGECDQLLASIRPMLECDSGTR